MYVYGIVKEETYETISKILSAENEPESIVKLKINRQDNLMVVATSDDNYKRRRRLSEVKIPKLLVVYMLNNWQNECKPKS